MLAQLAKQHALGDMIVVKPTYGTYDEHHFLVNLIDDEFDPSIKHINPCITVQKFMPNLKIEGEYSFIIYNNHISHSVLKLPSSLAHSLHSIYGRISQLVTPCDEDILAVQKILDSILHLTGEKVHKCRIDMIRCEKTQKLLLFELALGDPIQYLHLLSDEQQKRAINHFIDSTLIHLS
ncbi:hypothetical protein [uncultured Shewanella sp.]|uniref:hypothetical protein n=1 Tax=uncultured Shewanella sp. TaxID=173975 RepID=UPI0026371244|nr:hypothetical protein [uncultured Shewanella sp.]